MQIYKTTNLINGKIYIGKEKYNNPNYLGSGKILKFALKKYGIENFKKEILQECFSLEDLNEKEKYWIAQLKPFPPIGYNIGLGGGFGDILTNNPKKAEICKKYSKAGKLKTGNKNNFYGKTHSLKVRKKLSESAKLRTRDKNSFYGKKHSLESREKMIKNHKGMLGKHHSEKTKKKIGEAHIGNKNMLGKYHSEETKKKISLKNKGKVRTKEAKLNMSLAQKGHIPWNKGKKNCFSKETKLKMSMAAKNRSEESRRNMSNACKGKIPWNKGKKYSLCENTKQKMKLAAKKREETKLIKKCIYCNKEADYRLIGRWHNEKCKLKHEVEK